MTAHLYINHITVTLCSNFDICITWRWPLWSVARSKKKSPVYVVFLVTDSFLISVLASQWYEPI